MKHRIQIVPAICQRCGKPLMTTDRSPLGLDHLKARWGIICQSCITPEEQHQMCMEQGEALVQGQ